MKHVHTRTYILSQKKNSEKPINSSFSEPHASMRQDLNLRPLRPEEFKVKILKIPLMF